MLWIFAAFYLVNANLLSPAPLTSFQNMWVSNPISLSSNHAGDTVVLTLSLFSYVELPSGACVFLTLPMFPVTSVLKVLEEKIEAYSDFSVSFEGILLPSTERSYGPISVSIRTSEFGQVLAQNLVFGNIGISTAKPSPQGLTVSNLGSTLVSIKTSLKFSFAITTEIQKLDYMVLRLADFYVMDGAKVTWNQEKSGTQYFSSNGVDYAVDSITFYGLQDGIINSVDMEFTVEGIVNPSTIPVSSIWNIEILRFGTNTVIQRYQSVGTWITTGALSVTWTPSNTFTPILVQGNTAYMTTTFNTVSSIPSQGSLIITYSNVDISYYSYKSSSNQQLSINPSIDSSYISFTPSLLQCEVTSQTLVTCKANSLIPAKTQVKVYLLTYFEGTSPKISNIQTKDLNSNVIDNLLSAYTYTYSTSSALLTEPEIFITNNLAGDISSTAEYRTGPYTSAGISISFLSPISLSGTDIIDLKVLVENSPDSRDFSIAMQAPLYCNLVTSSSQVYDFTSTTACNQSPEISSDGISFTTDPVIPNADEWVNVLIYSGSQDNIGQFYAPSFSSGTHTRYEIILKFTVSSVTYQFIKPFTFIPYTLTSTSFELMCTSIGYKGIPVFMNLTPDYAYNPSVGYSAYIMFTITATTSFDSSLNTNLASGNEFPSLYKPTGSVFTIIYEEPSATFTKLKLALQGGVTSTLVEISFPFGELESNAEYYPIIQVGGYNTGTGEYFVMGETTGSSIYSEFDNTFLATEGVSSSLDYSTMIVNYEIDSTANYDMQNDFVVVFVSKFQYDSDLTVEFEGIGTSSLEFFSSQGDIPSYSVGYGTSPYIYSNGLKYILNSLETPEIDEGTEISFIFSSTNNSPCSFALTNSINLKVKALVPLYYYPLEANGFGADTQQLTFTLQLQSPNGFVYIQDHSITVITSDTLNAPELCRITIGSTLITSRILNNNCVGSFDANSNLIGNIYIEVTITMEPIYIQDYLSSFESVSITYANGALYRWESSSSGTSTLMNIGDLSIASGISKVTCFPKYNGSNLVQFSITFTPQFDLPAGTLITIQGVTFEDDTAANDNSFSSISFSNAYVQSGLFYLTTSEKSPKSIEISITKDYAFNIITTGASSSFYITATYLGATILEDKISDELPVQKIVFLAAPTAKFTEAVISSDLQSLGELAKYRLSFVISISMQEVWTVVIEFPRGYDSFIGNVREWYMDSPGEFYIDTLGTDISCIAEHWHMYCEGFGIVEPNTLMEIQFLAYNPVFANIGNYSVYIVNSLGVVQAKASISPLEFLDSIVNIIDIQSVSVTSHRDYTADYTFSTSFAQQISAGDLFTIQFPAQYKIATYNSIVTCSANYENLGASFDLKTACTVENNIIQYTISESVEISANFYVYFDLFEIIKPDNCYIRGSDLYFDAVSNLFTVYNLWTEKFLLTSFDQNGIKKGQSQFNLNSAYTGFFENDWKKIEITWFSPPYAIDIFLIKPGTYSKLCQISPADPELAAVAIELTPISELYFDETSYIITRAFPTTEFRVGAPEDFLEGVYYITWEITETPLVSGFYLYGQVPKTQVQVHLGSLVQVSIDQTPGIINRKMTYPIKVTTVDCNVFDDITVTFSLEDSDDRVTFEPQSISFAPDIEVRYFRLIFNEDSGKIADGIEFVVNYEISGTNKASFSDIGQTEISFDEGIAKSPAIANVQIEFESEIKGKIKLELNSPSIVSWAFGPSSSFLYDFYYNYEYISRYAYPMFADPTVQQLLLSDQVKNFKTYQNDYIQEVDWETYQILLRESAQDHSFFSMDFLSAGQHTLLSPDFVMSHMNYTIVIWADNYIENSTASIFKITNSLPYPGLISLTTPSENLTDIYTALAKSFQVPSNQLTEFSSLPIGQYKILLNSQYQYLYNPLEIFEKTSKETLDFYFTEANISSDYNISCRNASSNDFGVPAFLNISIEEIGSFLIINFTSRSDGHVCCIIEYEPDNTTELENDEILNGKNREGNLADYFQCVESLAGAEQTIEIELMIFEDIGSYTVTCTVCNHFPIENYCMDSETYATGAFNIFNTEISQGQILLSLSFLIISLA